jgi:pimeloyl-ACP methyl ester carboxylesterase
MTGPENVPAVPLEISRPAKGNSLRAVLILLLKIGIAAYVGVIIVLMALERHLIFHPATAADSWEPPTRHVQDVEFGMEGCRFHGWWAPLAGAKSAVLFCHGNAGNLSHRGYAIEQWHRTMQASVLLFDYPGYGRCEGKPDESGCYRAAEAAYQWLVNDAGVSPAHLIIVGESLGASVAVETARHHEHEALVLISGFTSIPDMAGVTFPLLPLRWLVRNRFDSLAKISECKRPVFIAHGTGDRIVPYWMSQKLFEAANEPKRLFTMQGRDHNEPPGEDFYRALGEFLDSSRRLPQTISRQ